MKQSRLPGLLAAALMATACAAPAADPTAPLAAPGLVFDEVDGMVAVEAEHFYKQTLTDKRAWHITSSKNVPEVKPDADRAHVAGASGGAYVEILPDTRATHGHPLIQGENFTDTPGLMAVLHYKVNIRTPGRYYIWVRSFSTGSEDNGVHVGLDGQWPESGQRWQTVQKNAWAWDCKQRTPQVHTGVPMQLLLDIEKAGEHEILFSLREDGFEMDKFVLAGSKDFKPEGQGPAVKVKSGTLPAAFPEVSEAALVPKTFPAHWGEPPAAQTFDLRPLPAGYGEGSGTLAKWIQDNLDKDAAASAVALKMEAASFSLEGTGYYLDQGKWLAINPAKNKSAQAKQAFPFPSGRYDVTLEAVGEEDGKSTYTVAVNDQQIGAHECPLALTPMEEGAQYHVKWRNQQIDSGDIIAVSSTIASAGGLEYSRARWARVTFAPADDATKAAAANLKPAAKMEAKRDAVALAPLVLPRQPDGKGTAAISGELKEWHKVTLTLDGPFAHELDNEPNPFTDCNLTVTFKHESGTPSYKVPGYFAADGKAGESSSESGTKWRAHLAPDKAGTWNYSVSFTRGKHAALDGGGAAVKPFDGVSGSFKVAKTDKQGRDFRGKGRLQYVGKHHLQFAGTQDYFLKAGPDSPESLLAYADFDNTLAMKPNMPVKTWEAHVQDWRAGDPAWKGGKGKGLIGALNYLAAKGVNSFSFLPYNAGGDGDNVWPFASRNDKLHWDCSKLDQWGVAFDHATAKGLYLHFKLQETEIDDNRRGEKSEGEVVPESLDGGTLGPQRKLYCREILARFGHGLALNWNIGEENTQTTDEINAMIDYIRATDPYQHHIVIHTYPGQQDKVYTPLLGDRSRLSGASLQNGWKMTHERTLKWVSQSARAGKPWVVANDEQGGADTGVPPDMGYAGYDGRKKDGTVVQTTDDIRKSTLWGNLMAGGAGVEYYFGYQLPQNDLVCEDWRSRDQSWDHARIALEFFHGQGIPFWDMKNANALIGNAKNDNSKYCLAKPGEVYLVFLAQGGTTDLDLTGARGGFKVKWFNPRTGGTLMDGSVKSVSAGGTVALGNSPSEPDHDWVVLVRGNELSKAIPAEKSVPARSVAYPYHFKFEGNPLARLHGAADPDAKVWDGVVWLYCSQDRFMKPGVHQHHYDAMDGYHAFSSTNLVDWTDHGEILHSRDVSWGKDGWMWAPGAARRNGKYYLYYPHADKSGTWRIGVALADSPAGPFKDSGKPMEGITGIDPMIFIDDDGEAYLYNNSAIVARLQPNMLELAEPVRKIDYAPREVLADEELKFLEGSYMHKKDGVYYYSYTNWKNKTNQGFYGMGKSPYGPFEWKGPMAPRPQGAQDHHSIIEFKGNWYYFYHIAIPGLPVNKEEQGRITCFDRLYYNPDGTLKMVEHTRGASR